MRNIIVTIAWYIYFLWKSCRQTNRYQAYDSSKTHGEEEDEPGKNTMANTSTPTPTSIPQCYDSNGEISSTKTACPAINPDSGHPFCCLQDDVCTLDGICYNVDNEKESVSSDRRSGNFYIGTCAGDPKGSTEPACSLPCRESFSLLTIC